MWALLPDDPGSNPSSRQASHPVSLTSVDVANNSNYHCKVAVRSTGGTVSTQHSAWLRIGAG